MRKAKFIGKYIDIKSLTKECHICCPKKVVRLSVKRNRIKRILRDSLRKKGLNNIFVYVKKDPGSLAGISLRKDMDDFIKDS